MGQWSNAGDNSTYIETDRTDMKFQTEVKMFNNYWFSYYLSLKEHLIMSNKTLRFLIDQA